MGRGMGMGRGRGMGRGKRIGRGMGISSGSESGNTFQRILSKDQELSLLKNQSKDLMQQMEDIQTRIRRLEKSD